MSKLPEEAFSFYVSLGPDRSYAAVGKKYGVTKRTVCSRAAKEKWRERLEKIESDARERTDQKMTETMEEMTSRHLKAVKVIQGKSLETLRSLSLTSAMDAIRALDLAIKQERLIRGEPSERKAVSLEETIRREMQSWLVVDAEEDDESDER